MPEPALTRPSPRAARQRRALTSLLAALAILLVVTVSQSSAAARGSIYSQVLAAYKANGLVPPCQFTGAQLESALKGIDTYGAQYFSDFSGAIRTALSARDVGQCRPRGAAGGSGASVRITRGVGPLPAVTAPTGAGVPLPLIMLAVMAGIGLLGGGLAGLSRRRDPLVIRTWRHAWAEAAHRAGAAWLDLLDWLAPRARRGR